MSRQNINEIKYSNSLNSSLQSYQNGQNKENIGYNCSECSSLIEILSIEENNLEFKCVNDENHNSKLSINNYLERMKQYIDNKNFNERCEKHNDEYRVYCLDCKSHLCQDCLPSRLHLNHNKKILSEIKPNQEELDIIKKRIEFYKNKIKNIKYNKNKEIKNELNNKKLSENGKIKKIIKSNKIRKLKELKNNKDKYINDINEIKRRYEKEIKLRKIQYEKDNNNINNKYKIIYNKEITLYKNKIKKLKTIYNKIFDKLKK